MRLIDADAASARVKPYDKDDEKWAITGGTALRLIHNTLDNSPTIDAVPVVWCKDCKLYRVYMGRSMCAKNATLLDGHEVGLRATEKDGFCNCGAKMDGGVGNAGSM